MADEQLSQEQLIEEQKARCPFCRIVSGAIPSRKVFENDRFLAVLDINPAAPGAVILMPKEHIALLAIMPEDLRTELFALASKLGIALQESMITSRITMVCPNGHIAGQNAAYHLLFYLIPRDKGDGLSMLDIENLATPQADAIALSPLFEQMTRQVLAHVGRDDLLKTHHIHKKEHDPPHDAPNTLAATTHTAPQNSSLAAPIFENAAEKNMAEKIPAVPSTVEFSTPSAALEHVLAMSPELRRFIIMQPELVVDYIKNSPKLAKLFEGVDIAALSHMLQAQEEAARIASQQNPSSTDYASNDAPDDASAQPSEPEMTAREMKPRELFAFIDGNQGLRQWLLEHPKELAANINKNPKLQAFFEGVDIMDLAHRYRDFVLKRGAL
jgi:histidine triad (HIT) family protein